MLLERLEDGDTDFSAGRLRMKLNRVFEQHLTENHPIKATDAQRI
jgi:hypothetical protein